MISNIDQKPTKLKIITDSSCDLPDAFLKEYDIDYVPFYVNIAGKSYIDRTELKPEVYYEQLKSIKDLPTTSAPSPKDFFDKVNSVVKDYSTVLITTISSKLSATYQSARVAAKRLREKSVHVFDSLSGSGGVGLLCLAAAKLARQGLKEDNLIKEVERIRKETILLGYVDNLENLVKSGRISNFKYLIGRLMKAKPILQVKDGLIQPLSKASGKEKAIKKMLNILYKRVDEDVKYDIMITHGDDYETSNNILQQIEKKVELGEKIINFLTPALATHLGLGTIVVTLSPSVD